MPNPVTKATKRSLHAVVDETMRLVETTLKAQERNPKAELKDHVVELLLDQDLEHERTQGLDLGAEVEGQINPALPANAKLDVGFSREGERSGTGSVGGRFGYTLTIPPREVP